MLSKKRAVPYSKIMGRLSCCPSFALLRPQLCLSGEPDYLQPSPHQLSTSLQADEGQLHDV